MSVRVRSGTELGSHQQKSMDITVLHNSRVILPGFVDGHLELFLLQLGPTLLVRTHYLRTRYINRGRNYISTFKTPKLVGIRDTDLSSRKIAVFRKEKICWIQINNSWSTYDKSVKLRFKPWLAKFTIEWVRYPKPNSDVAKNVFNA